MMETMKSTIPYKVFEFILEEHNRGISHDRIAKKVRDKFGHSLTKVDITTLINDYETGSDDARYKVDR